MESDLIRKLGALAHPTRLATFQLLMRRYPGAVSAGEISTSLGLKAATSSDGLSALKDAGLIDCERDGRSLLYSIDLEGAKALNESLFADCCRSRADICSPSNPLSGGIKTMEKPFNTLFICSGNSARSIMAEAILNQEGLGRFKAYSAGAKPSSELNPFTIKLLQDKGYETSGLYSKNLDTFQGTDAPAFDFIFTVCDDAANEECPAWPGQPVTAHWGLPDPVKAEGTDAEKTLAFQQAYGTLLNRIRAFTALPVETLDAISLQAQVDDIGRSN